MSGVHGVGEHAQGLVAEAPRMVQGLSHNRLPMVEDHALDNQQKLDLAILIHVQIKVTNYM